MNSILFAVRSIGFCSYQNLQRLCHANFARKCRKLSKVAERVIVSATIKVMVSIFVFLANLHFSTNLTNIGALWMPQFFTACSMRRGADTYRRDVLRPSDFVTSPDHSEEDFIKAPVILPHIWRKLRPTTQTQ